MLEPELCRLWAALPLGRRSAVGTLRALAESTGIDEVVLERHWREALPLKQLGASLRGRSVPTASSAKSSASMT